MVNSLLDWFEDNKYGVIGTLTLHSLVLLGLTIWSIRTVPTEEERSDMRIEVIDEEEAERLLENMEREAQGLPPLEVTNLTSNITAEAKPTFSSERLAQRVEGDLKAFEQAEFDRLAQERREQGKEVTIPELDPSKWNKELYMDKAAEPVKVEGATTVWHDLQGRTRANDVPGYLCRTQGRVAIRIAVDRSGAVVKAELDPARSTGVDECMLENAMRSAKRARFNSDGSAPNPHNGTLFFLFLPQ